MEVTYEEQDKYKEIVGTWDGNDLRSDHGGMRYTG